jgi:hypothetical protein
MQAELKTTTDLSPIATLREEARDPEGDGRRKGREATSKELGGGPEQEKEKGW